MADQIPLKVLKNEGVAYALSDFVSGDTINPVYGSYDSTGNEYLTGTTVQQCLQQTEQGLEFFDQPPAPLQYFSAYCNQVIEFFHAESLMPFDTIDIDTENGYNATNKSYTIPTKGVWIISMRQSLWDKQHGDNYYPRFLLYVNGIYRKEFIQDHIAAKDNADLDIAVRYCTLSGSVAIDLDVGDVIEIYYSQNATYNMWTLTGRETGDFSGYLHRETI